MQVSPNGPSVQRPIATKRPPPPVTLAAKNLLTPRRNCLQHADLHHWGQRSEQACRTMDEARPLFVSNTTDTLRQPFGAVRLVMPLPYGAGARRQHLPRSHRLARRSPRSRPPMAHRSIGVIRRVQLPGRKTAPSRGAGVSTATSKPASWRPTRTRGETAGRTSRTSKSLFQSPCPR